MWLIILALLVTTCLISGGSSDLSSPAVASGDLLKKLQEVAGIYKDANKAKSMGVDKAVLVTACNHGFLNHLFNFDCFVRRLGKPSSYNSSEVKITLTGNCPSLCYLRYLFT